MWNKIANFIVKFFTLPIRSVVLRRQEENLQAYHKMLANTDRLEATAIQIKKMIFAGINIEKQMDKMSEVRTRLSKAAVSSSEDATKLAEKMGAEEQLTPEKVRDAFSKLSSQNSEFSRQFYKENTEIEKNVLAQRKEYTKILRTIQIQVEQDARFEKEFLYWKGKKNINKEAPQKKKWWWIW